MAASLRHPRLTSYGLSREANARRQLLPSSRLSLPPRPLAPHKPRRSPCVAVRAAAAGGASIPDESESEDPYKVLGLSPMDSFDQVKVAHRKRTREAQGDDAKLQRIERAYDRIMMLQLTRRKQGVTYGAMKVSEEIKYADSDEWFPWKPKYERSDKRSILMNAALSALMALWIVVAQQTDYKVLQILLSYYVFILFMKLDPFYPQKPEDEEKKWAKNGRRLTRSLGLVFGCVVVASVLHQVAYYGFSFFGYYVPRALLQFQEMLITLACSFGMFNIGSFYR